MGERTTAQLRRLAHEAEREARWADAATLYQEAIDAYPAKGQLGGLAAHDLAQLRKSVRENLSLAEHNAPRPGAAEHRVALDAPGRGDRWMGGDGAWGNDPTAAAVFKTEVEAIQAALGHGHEIGGSPSWHVWIDATPYTCGDDEDRDASAPTCPNCGNPDHTEECPEPDAGPSTRNDEIPGEVSRRIVRKHLSEIAGTVPGREDGNLVLQGSDSRDFFEVAATSLQSALSAAYQAGCRAGPGGLTGQIREVYLVTDPASEQAELGDVVGDPVTALQLARIVLGAGPRILEERPALFWARARAEAEGRDRLQVAVTRAATRRLREQKEADAKRLELVRELILELEGDVDCEKPLEILQAWAAEIQAGPEARQAIDAVETGELELEEGGAAALQDWADRGERRGAWRLVEELEEGALRRDLFRRMGALEDELEAFDSARWAEARAEDD